MTTGSERKRNRRVFETDPAVCTWIPARILMRVPFYLPLSENRRKYEDHLRISRTGRVGISLQKVFLYSNDLEMLEKISKN